VFDSFPYDKWDENIKAFWTFGPGGSTGTYIMTVLGVIFMFVAFIAWVRLEDQKLKAQAQLLRAAGGLRAPSGVPPGPGPSEPPPAGQQTDPGA
jgi:hypothetical protein